MLGEKESSDPFESLLNALAFPRIFQAYRMAVQPSKLVIALMAIAIISVTAWIMDFTTSVAVTRDDCGRIVSSELEVYISSQSGVSEYAEAADEDAGFFRVLWHCGSARFHNAILSLINRDLAGLGASIRDCMYASKWAFSSHWLHTLYSVIFLPFSFMLMAIAGCAICRMAAVQLARGEKLGLFTGLGFGFRRFLSCAGAPSSLIAIAIVVAGPILVVGLFSNIPWIGEFTVGVLSAVLLVLGAVVTIILVGLLGGAGLMSPAVAYDGSDVNDAINRSFSYVYLGSLHLIVYTALAAVYGAISYLIMRLFVFLILLVTRWFLVLAVWADSSGGQPDKMAQMWPEPTYMNLMTWPASGGLSWPEYYFGAVPLGLSQLMLLGLLAAFVISFYFSAQTIIYALMRKKVDNTPLCEVYDRFDPEDVDADVDVESI